MERQAYRASPAEESLTRQGFRAGLLEFGLILR